MGYENSWVHIIVLIRYKYLEFDCIEFTSGPIFGKLYWQILENFGQFWQILESFGIFFGKFGFFLENLAIWQFLENFSKF